MSTSSSTSTPAVPAPDRTTVRRFAAWPLLITACGVLGVVALFGESRPDASGTDFDYPVTADAATALDHLPFRISGVLGYLLVLLMLVTAAVWRHRVERRFDGSIGATLVSIGVIASAALVALTYGWRGAIGNYFPGGGEDDSYDAEALYIYYVMNDFSAYVAFVPLLASAFGLTWMAFHERLVSRVLGAVAGLFAAALLLAVVVTGVPGLPAMILAGLVVAGLWLAVGNSAITQDAR